MLGRRTVGSPHFVLAQEWAVPAFRGEQKMGGGVLEQPCGKRHA